MPTKKPTHARAQKEMRHTQQATFLTAYARCGIVLQAAAEAGIRRQLVYEWRKADSAFAEAYLIAESDANDVIRGEIFRRGVDGWNEVTFTETTDDTGAVIKTETKSMRHYSDAMLRLIAQSRMPEFRDRLDVTSGDESLGVQAIYDRISGDPTATAAVCDILAIVGRHDRSAESAAGRAGDAGE